MIRPKKDRYSRNKKWACPKYKIVKFNRRSSVIITTLSVPVQELHFYIKGVSKKKEKNNIDIKTDIPEIENGHVQNVT